MSRRPEPRVTRDIDEVCERLQRGGACALPTETVYGLAARVHDHDALRRVFAVKGRPLFDPLIVHVADADQARRMTAAWPRAAARLAERYWPGPLTLVLPRSTAAADIVTAGLDTVGVRAPDHPATLEVLRRVGPLAAPSANRFGRTSPTRPEHVAAEFPDEDLLILDGGPCGVGIESTVLALDIDADRSVAPRAGRVLRPGPISRDALEAALGAVVEQQRSRSDPGRPAQAPGTLDRHYEPGVPVVIVNAEERRVSTSADEARFLSDPVVAAVARAARLRALTSVEVSTIHLADEPTTAARTLYADLRVAASSDGVRAIAIIRRPHQRGPAWTAIWDRLERAACGDVDERC